MKDDLSPDLISGIRNALEDFRNSRENYPCRKEDLVDEVSREHAASRKGVERALKGDASLVIEAKRRGLPQYVVFAGDEALVYGISAESVMAALTEIAGPASIPKIAKELDIGSGKAQLECLQHQLSALLETGSIRKTTRGYTPAPAIKRGMIIDVLAALKQAHTYPASLEQVFKPLRLARSDLPAVKAIVGQMVADEVLLLVPKDKTRAYMLAGDDMRYAAKADARLKFELLEEIETLKGQILELQARGLSASSGETAAPTISSDSNDDPVTDQTVLAAIRRIAKHNRRRSVDLWRLREALADIPRDQTDRSLERMGTAWRIELQPVQDSTTLSPRQKDAVLKLSDGTMIVSVAADPE